MKLDTKYIGKVMVNELDFIEFPNGLPGFDDEKSFILLDFPGNPVFCFLQSTNTPELAFILTNPHHFYQEYAFDLDDNLANGLHIQSEKDVSLFTIVTLKDPFSASTINLKAPIIIHSRARLGRQYILQHDTYPSKASLYPANSTTLKGES